ncbi:MAG: hypothetical protein Q9201_004350 [Fulgogasparrea decipioides]
MKEALKAKDQTRLNVLRGILTEITASEKEARPVKTNRRLFQILQKRQNTCKAAAKEFEDAGREDLSAKENEQIRVLQEYLNNDSFVELSEDETVAAIKAAVEDIVRKELTPKRVREVLFREGGAFEDRITDGETVSKNIMRLVHEAAPLENGSKKWIGTGAQ